MNPLRIHYLQHVPFEGLGYVAAWADAHGHRLTATFLFDKPVFPRQESFDWLVIMGGPMGVYEEAGHSWMKAEKEFIRASIESGKTVIGICLGSQLIAEALGAKVYPHRFREIGWFPIRFTVPAVSGSTAYGTELLTVFHWHGDTFDLPEGARLLASSEACTNQAFLYGDRVLGLQFHVEMTADGVRQLVRHCAHELTPQPHVQPADALLSEEYFSGNHSFLSGMLDELQRLHAQPPTPARKKTAIQEGRGRLKG